jgi:hypothetical protein
MSHCLVPNQRKILRPIVGRNRLQVREMIAYSESLMDGVVAHRKCEGASEPAYLDSEKPH